MSKLCDCGCGGEIQPTKTDKEGTRRYIHGHNRRKLERVLTLRSQGYKLIWKPDHHRASVNGYVAEHIVILEEKLGRKILYGEVVHHKDGNKTNNDPSNLEVFSSPGQHYNHHVSIKAEEKCGHSDWRRCYLCRLYDDPKYLKHPRNGAHYHKECMAQYEKTRRYAAI